MFTHTTANTTELKTLKLLLEEKYLNLSVHDVFADNNTLTVKLFNGANGVDEGIDRENIAAINYFKLFNAKIGKEAAAHSYWSYSVITLPASHLQNVIKGLEMRPTPAADGDFGRFIAMC